MKSLQEQHMKISKALVFDIKRFAIHDGEGIRTTIFFKGCPLRCKWCQNPEGLLSKRKPVYLKNKCIHCRRCEQYAKENQIIYENDRPNFCENYLGDFDNLIRACPTQAIRYDSEEYSIDELMKKIKQDEVFIKRGGVTFSGGEPFMQGEFLIEMLKQCKAQGIHTAVESSLYTKLDYIKRAIPYIDTFYVDLKVFDEEMHEKLTGVFSKKIKSHIKYVLESPYKDRVIIRTPLIPTMTATDDNISAITQYLVSLYPNVKYELLNYNPLASSKYELVNMEYGVDTHYQMFNQEQMQHFYDIVYQNGLKNLILE